MEVLIKKASISDAKQVASLFNSYRIFYNQTSDENGALEFVTERLSKSESTVFIAKTRNEECLGFVQLYPSFSSQFMQRMWILNDLYVSENYRMLGIASALIQAAKEHASRTKARGLILCTQDSNHQAQALYKKIGFEPLRDYQWHVLTVNA